MSRRKPGRRFVNPLSWTSFPTCSAAFAAVAALFATANGAGLSPDSAAYLSSGYHLASGDGLRTYSGHALTVFPPGLAIVAAFGEWMAVGGEASVRIFNALSFSATVLLGFALLRKHVRSEGLAVLCTLLLAVGLPLLSLAGMIYSESVFVVVCLGFILALERAGARDSPYPSLLAAGVLVWIAFLFRYAGLALIPAGAVAALLLFYPRGRGAAVRAAAAFSAVATVAPLAWMLRNRSLDGTFMGARGPSTQGVEDVVVRYVGTVGHWILPFPTPWQLRQMAGAALLLGLLAWGILALVRHLRAGDSASVLERIGAVLPLACFVVVYSLYLAAATLATALDPIDGRLLSPVYVPLVVLAASVAEGAWREIPRSWRARLHPAVVVFLALFLLGQAFASARWVQRSARAGIGFASATWQASRLIAASEELPAHAVLFSNFPDAVWAVSPGRMVRWVPREPDYPVLTGDPLPALADFLDSVACHESYLLWFDQSRSWLRLPADLREHVELAPVSRYPDGTIYSIRSRPLERGSSSGTASMTAGSPECRTSPRS